MVTCWKLNIQLQLVAKFQPKAQHCNVSNGIKCSLWICEMAKTWISLLPSIKWMFGIKFMQKLKHVLISPLQLFMIGTPYRWPAFPGRKSTLSYSFWTKAPLKSIAWTRGISYWNYYNHKATRTLTELNISLLAEQQLLGWASFMSINFEIITYD